MDDLTGAGARATDLTATCWSDLCCPWCWLGRDRTRLLRDLGVDVTVRPYELHPELQRTGGKAIRPGGRLDTLLRDTIGRECAELGLDFVAPTRVPATNRALRTIEVVRADDRGAAEALEDALYRAVWVDGLAVDDPAVLDRLVTSAGAPAARVRALVDDGGGWDALEAARREAHEHGVAGTPAWRFEGNELVLPGVQPRELYERVVDRLRARAGDGR